MRLTAAKIKEAILHPEAEVRRTALHHFTDARIQDTSLMPLVIQAVEAHGLADSYMFLRSAARLPQTAASVDWVIRQFDRSFELANIEDDNLRHALALVLVHADPALLIPRQGEILGLGSFPERLKPAMTEVIQFHAMDWASLWVAFEQLGRQTLQREAVTQEEARCFDRLVRAMARHADAGGDVVLNLLRHNFKGRDKDAMKWLEPQVIELAGAMGLQTAVPLLMKHLEIDHDDILDSLITGLVGIGGDAVVKAIAQQWWPADNDARSVMTEVLQHIHTDLALERAVFFLSKELDDDLRLFLGHAILDHFATEGIEPVRRLVLGDRDDLDNEQVDLRDCLVATATIMGATFPEYEQWHEEAVACNYGWRGLEPVRLADTYFGEFKFHDEKTDGADAIDEGGADTNPDDDRLFQLKITLRDIAPAVWRRVLVQDCELLDLHMIIQIVMGWDEAHLYAFKMAGKQYADLELMEGEWDGEDAAEVMLSDLLTRKGQKLQYEYDFGDGWIHEIELENIVEAADDQIVPLCLGGARACPPEDVGGPWGYAEYLAALADPRHEQHEDMLEWNGPFDAEAFDLKAINRELRDFM